MVLLPDYFLYQLPDFLEIRFGLLTGDHPNFDSTVNNIKMMAMLTYEMGLILNYMLYIIFLEELTFTQ
jgi:hypothetical protein